VVTGKSGSDTPPPTVRGNLSKGGTKVQSETYEKLYGREEKGTPDNKNPRKRKDEGSEEAQGVIVRVS